jgi:hypothetical protein
VICYLCTKPINDEASADRDHVPARSYFPKSIRTQFNPNLDWLWTHKKCNAGMRMDEEYFLASIGPMAIGDFVGDALAEDLKRSYERPEQRKLGLQAVNEFSRLVTSDGLQIKSYNHARAAKVLWKISRGLAFLETEGAMIIPPDTPHEVRLYPSKEEIQRRLIPEGWWAEMLQLQPMGRYGRVLDYRTITLFTRDAAGQITQSSQAWGLLLWNRVIAGVFFHNPWCPCGDCAAHRAKSAASVTPKE